MAALSSEYCLSEQCLSEQCQPPEKNVCFQRKTGHISETVREQRLLLIPNRKCYAPCQLRLILDDLEGR